MLFKKERGFTLVELLIVVCIVTLLASLAIIKTITAQKNARDTERRTELKNLEVALRLYRDAYGRYPAAGCGVASNSSWTSPGPGSAAWYTSCDTYIAGLAPNYIPSLPTDPHESELNNGYLYMTDASGTNYKLMAHNTVESGIVASTTEMARCPVSCGLASCNQSTYAIYSSGAACW